MAPAHALVLLFVLLIGLVHAIGYSPQDEGQGLGQGGRNNVGGRQDGFGQQGATRGGFRSGADAGGYGSSQYGGTQGEDARQYTFRIYTEPEYTGYESKFPGGKAMYKSYRSTDSGFGRQGAEGEYGASGRGGAHSGGFGAGGQSSGFGAGGRNSYGSQSHY